MAKLTEEIIAKIMKRVRRDTTIQLETGCHIWRGYCDPHDGYPMMSVTLRAGRTTWRVHRVVWRSTHGVAVPEGAHVRHLCGHLNCLNPAHMMLGTAADNWRTFASGHQIRKISAAQALEIIERWKEGEGEAIKGLARQFGVTPQAIRNIVHGRTWHAKLKACRG